MNGMIAGALTEELSAILAAIVRVLYVYDTEPSNLATEDELKTFMTLGRLLAEYHGRGTDSYNSIPAKSVEVFCQWLDERHPELRSDPRYQAPVHRLLFNAFERRTSSAKWLPTVSGTEGGEVARKMRLIKSGFDAYRKMRASTRTRILDGFLSGEMPKSGSQLQWCEPGRQDILADLLRYRVRVAIADLQRLVREVSPSSPLVESYVAAADIADRVWWIEGRDGLALLYDRLQPKLSWVEKVNPSAVIRCDDTGSLRIPHEREGVTQADPNTAVEGTPRTEATGGVADQSTDGADEPKVQKRFLGSDGKSLTCTNLRYVFCGVVWREYKARVIARRAQDGKSKPPGIRDAFPLAKEYGWPSCDVDGFYDYAKEGIRPNRPWSGLVIGKSLSLEDLSDVLARAGSVPNKSTLPAEADSDETGEEPLGS